MHHGLVSASEVSVLKENRKIKETRQSEFQIQIDHLQRGNRYCSI